MDTVPFESDSRYAEVSASRSSGSRASVSRVLAQAVTVPSTRPVVGSTPRPFLDIQAKPAGDPYHDDLMSHTFVSGRRDIEGLAWSPPSRSDLSAKAHGCRDGCFRLQHVRVDELLEGDTLGLLLHGTLVVGYSHPDAESHGWKTDDQIVEVNGEHVSTFEEFLQAFNDARLARPIDFAVLRREVGVEVDDAANSRLDGFLSSANLCDLAVRLQRSRGSPSAVPVSANPEIFKDPVTDNPYIRALRSRRDAMFMPDHWADTGDSLPAKLATRAGALATLADGVDHERRKTLPTNLTAAFMCSMCICEEDGELVTSPRFLGVQPAKSYNAQSTLRGERAPREPPNDRDVG
mmetsp:Transcript_1430/g.3829  ORF Transcript_1430/g.3829 Transcript_1430/m.3829 type:complete len:349 (-) Transcript_1430:279-1325(-)